MAKIVRATFSIVSTVALCLFASYGGGWAGPVVFGPYVFERQTGEPQKVAIPILINDSEGPFWLQISNGSSGVGLVTSGFVVLNGDIVARPNEFNQKTLAFTVDVALAATNILEVELRGAPGTFITIWIRRANTDTNRFNSQHDLWARREPNNVPLWWEIEDQADEYVVLRGGSAAGPWHELGRRSADRANAVDYQPSATEPCYQVTALNGSGMPVRRYEALCLNVTSDPQARSSINVTTAISNEAGKAQNEATNAQNVATSSSLSGTTSPFNEMCLSDREFTNASAMNAQEVDTFLSERDSFLRGDIFDVDAVIINPSQIIAQAAAEFQISAKVLLATLEKEQSAVTSRARLSDTALRFIMGYDLRNAIVPLSKKSIREQIRDAAAQFRRDFNRLSAIPPSPTAGGWQVGVAHAVTDTSLLVTPTKKTVAVLFSYNPEIGERWGGGKLVGGNCRFCEIWFLFGFASTLEIVGGTYFDRDFGLIGTAFLANPVSPAGMIAFVDITGPTGWNRGNPFRCFGYHPLGTAANRSMCWDVHIVPVMGSYIARGTVDGQEFVSEVAIDASSQLAAPQITALRVDAGQVTMEWTAPSTARSFLVRVNPLPFIGEVTRDIVVAGSARSALLNSLNLVPGAQYQAVVFAFSQDVMTPEPIASAFNIGAHGVIFTAPAPPPPPVLAVQFMQSTSTPSCSNSSISGGIGGPPVLALLAPVGGTAWTRAELIFDLTQLPFQTFGSFITDGTQVSTSGISLALSDIRSVSLTSSATLGGVTGTGSGGAVDVSRFDQFEIASTLPTSDPSYSPNVYSTVLFSDGLESQDGWFTFHSLLAPVPCIPGEPGCSSSGGGSLGIDADGSSGNAFRITLNSTQAGWETFGATKNLASAIALAGGRRYRVSWYWQEGGPTPCRSSTVYIVGEQR